ncbi:MAG: filamentous hemagglutinin N-terminal domain-containing protein, partial [Chloroflexota bacterium]
MLRYRQATAMLGLAFGLGLWLGLPHGLSSADAAESSQPNVVHGAATFNQAGPNWNINASSNKTVINWHSFGVPQGSVTNFNLPKPSSMILNRVTGGLSSGIYGQLNSNGRVFLVNASGILIGPSGVINTRSFAAATLDVEDAAFLATGKMRFSGNTDATVVNLGTIEASDGDVLLLAPQVENHGTILATH